MKLVNLILYSDNIPEYVEMKNMLEKYLSKLQNFIYYFYCFDSSISTEYEIRGNTIYIRGSETSVPGILDKTIKAIQITNKIHSDYDYIVRTNISTIVNFPLLQQFLMIHKNENYDYIGPTKVLTWCDIPSGIIDDKYYKTQFVCGICIILSKKIVDLLLSNIHILDYSVIDDVALGVFFNNYSIVKNDITNMVIENSAKFYHSKLIFRNKSESRYRDTRNMNTHIINLIHNLQVQNMI